MWSNLWFDSLQSYICLPQNCGRTPRVIPQIKGLDETKPKDRAAATPAMHHAVQTTVRKG
ncbi:hypothetical protein J6590_042112 [Homalodisca vitripennis]|nr:hypothetical protein J6590_042112 [Homalodisca vitripennis]